MGPFVIFVIVLIFIWTVSAISSAANKQKEAQRRAQLREQMARAGIMVPAMPTAARPQQLRAPQQSPAQIAAGIAQRFPDVLLPPAPDRRLPAFQQRTPRLVVKTPQRQPQRQVQRQPQRQPQRQQQSAARRPANAPIAPPPIEAPPVPQPRPAEIAPVKTATALPRIGAKTLNRWLQPTTLNQQFLLTEILQPPVSLREKHL